MLVASNESGLLHWLCDKTKQVPTIFNSVLNELQVKCMAVLTLMETTVPTEFLVNRTLKILSNFCLNFPSASILLDRSIFGLNKQVDKATGQLTHLNLHSLWKKIQVLPDILPRL